MSSRYHDYDKGSSRSARDDSRRHERADSRREDRRRSRSRSRSPRRRFSPRNSTEERTPRSQDRDRRDHDRRQRNKSPSSLEHEENVPAPPPPPRITKISIDFTKPKAPIKMSIGGAPKPTTAAKPAVASVFNNDDDEEPEEMPAEARMRMRNIGRETPTSAGPNSFGKTKQGFCDAKKVFEKNLKQALETAEKPSGSKFPQTIYKIKGP